MLLESSTSLTRSRLTGTGARLLITGNAAHADLHPDGAGSGLFGLLLAMLGQQVGFPVPEGGAGRLADALVARLTEHGGDLRCGTEVTRIEVDHGRAVAVRTADGSRIQVRRAILADVSAPALYGALLDPADVPVRTRRAMQRFEWDPATVKVDWALSGPVPWRGTPDLAPGTIHLAASDAEVSTTMSQVAAHVVPDRPFLLMGQMTTADPSRSPAGTEALWAYTKVPRQISADAGAEGAAAITGRWDAADADRMADRMQARIEEYAPGFGERVLARRVLTPLDLQRRNTNLDGGSIGGGTSAVHQQLIFRPIPGNGRPTTPIRGCSWRRHRHIPAAACTAPAGRTLPLRRSLPVGSAADARSFQRSGTADPVTGMPPVAVTRIRSTPGRPTCRP